MSAELFRQINQNNEAFAAQHKPSISFAEFPNIKAPMVITCMDPRCNPNEFWNFSEEGPVPIRNAGGRVTEDALRSVRVLSAVMGNGQNTVGCVAVVHHTDCGLRNSSNEDVARGLKLHSNLSGERAAEVDKMDFLSWKSAPTVADSVREDMEILKNDPYLPKEMEIIGYEYDVFTGKTKEVGVMYRN